MQKGWDWHGAHVKQKPLQAQSSHGPLGPRALERGPALSMALFALDGLLLLHTVPGPT